MEHILQPSARPQGVPVGPQSTCHAPDRAASTMSIPHPLGTRVNAVKLVKLRILSLFVMPAACRTASTF